MLAPAMQAMKQLVASGALGDVYWAWGSTGGWIHDEPTRRGEGALGAVDPSWYYRPAGGPLRDVTVYVLHSLTGILGPAQRVTAMSGIRTPAHEWRDKTIPVEVDDNSLLLLDFGNATFAMAGGHASRTGELVQWGAMGIYGSAGAIETLEIEPLSGPSHAALHHRDTTGPRQRAGLRRLKRTVPTPCDAWLPYVTRPTPPSPSRTSTPTSCTPSTASRSGEHPLVSGEHGAHVVEIIEKGYQAARTGQTQELESRF